MQFTMVVNVPVDSDGEAKALAMLETAQETISRHAKSSYGWALTWAQAKRLDVGAATAAGGWEAVATNPGLRRLRITEGWVYHGEVLGLCFVPARQPFSGR